MSGWDFIWIALGYFLAALVGAVIGAWTVVAVFLRMHNNSLPPKERR